MKARFLSARRLWEHMGNATFLVLLLALTGILAWLSVRYSWQSDWSADGRHSLTQADRELLERIAGGEIRITAFVHSESDKEAVRNFVARYQEVRPSIALDFIDPLASPNLVREYGIQVSGELLVQYRQRRENLQPRPSREGLGKNYAGEDFRNALRRLSAEGKWRLRFLSGHGERRAHGQANHDLRQWSAQLERRGYEVKDLPLGTVGGVPADTDVLVIAGPRTELLQPEAALLRRYWNEGGNILWLSDPEPETQLQGWRELARTLGVRFRDGVVLDNVQRLQGLGDPSILLLDAQSYPTHPVLEGFDLLTLFAEAGSVERHEAAGDAWHSQPLLLSSDQSWLETGEFSGHVQYDAGTDLPGPLTLALALERTLGSGDMGSGDSGERQRAIFLGDGDFLSNTLLQNGGNGELGIRMVSWLAGADSALGLPPEQPEDARLALSQRSLVLRAMSFALLLPAALLAAGAALRWRRRKR